MFLETYIFGLLDDQEMLVITVLSIIGASIFRIMVDKTLLAVIMFPLLLLGSALGVQAAAASPLMGYFDRYELTMSSATAGMIVALALMLLVVRLSYRLADGPKS